MGDVPSEPTVPGQCPDAETRQSPTLPDSLGPPRTAFPRAEAEQSLDHVDAFLLLVSNLGEMTSP